MNKLPTAPRPITAAAIAKPKSSPLTRRAAGGAAGRGGAEGGGAPGALFGGPATRAAGAPVAGAVGAGRAEGGGALGAACPAAGAPLGGAPTPPVGKVGNLMVAVGLGGKLIRTVSFLPAGFGGSAGLGGIGPPGGFGTLSAIQNVL